MCTPPLLNQVWFINPTREIRLNHVITVIGRLRPGVTPQQAQIEMDQHAAYAHTGDVMTMNALMADAHEGITAFLDKRQPAWVGQ